MLEVSHLIHRNVLKEEALQSIALGGGEDSSLTTLPLVDLRYHHNISSWLKLRTVLLSVGSVFRTRLRVYGSLSLLVLVGLAVYMMVSKLLHQVCVSALLLVPHWYEMSNEDDKSEFEYES